MAIGPLQRRTDGREPNVGSGRANLCSRPGVKNTPKQDVPRGVEAPFFMTGLPLEWVEVLLKTGRIFDM